MKRSMPLLLLLLIVLLAAPTPARAQNQPPVADAGEDQTVYIGESILLHGSATDPDDDPIQAWHWAIESSAPGSTPVLSGEWSADVNFIADVAGEYELSLVAYDGLDWSTPDFVTITYVVNQPPTAVASANPTAGPPPLSVDFDGSASFDPEGQPLAYLWEFGDGTPPVLASQTSHSFTSPGVYNVELAVEDVAGQRDYDTVIITVHGPAVPVVSPIGMVLATGLMAGAGYGRLRSSARQPPESAGNGLPPQATSDRVIDDPEAADSHRS